MVAKSYTPDRHDVVWVDLDPSRGHEQARVRPALVLSRASYSKKTGLMIACAITSHPKGYPFEVAVAGDTVHGVVLVDQIRTLDWKSRNVRFIERVSRGVMEEVEAKVRVLIL
jgi:mRNA interferase MazF